MSSFAVTVEKIIISAHPNADKLELANIKGYQAVVLKDQFKTGDLVAYIPEQALVPEELLKELGLSGRLAGPEHNRVKAIRIRGILSQGIVLPAASHWVEGQDVTEELKITKWEPKIPSYLAGEIYFAGSDKTIKYEIENIKKFPRVLEPGEEVFFTEKVHGTWACFGILPPNWTHPQYGNLLITSKGLSASGKVFKPDAEANKGNLYVRTAKALDIKEKILNAFKNEVAEEIPIYVLGEIFGKGVQDLFYGFSVSSDEQIGFRVFDIYVGKPGMGRYLNDLELDEACLKLSLSRVPVLYRGPFWHSKVANFTDGRETLSGKALHIREGIVIRPQIERRDLEIGRVQLKSISGDYLTRDGDATEYN